jgi:hypothetical protein
MKARPGTDIFNVATSWIIAYFSLSMSTNVICSGEHIITYPIVPRVFHTHARKIGAIAGRIFLVGRQITGSTNRWPIIFTIVESSALYAFGVVAALVSFLCGSNGQYAAVDALVPLVVSYAPHLLTSSTHSLILVQGIVFSLIVLQIRYHISATTSHLNSGKPPTRGLVGVQQSVCPESGDEPDYHARPQSIQMMVRVTKQSHTYCSSDRDKSTSLISASGQLPV